MAATPDPTASEDAGQEPGHSSSGSFERYSPPLPAVIVFAFCTLVATADILGWPVQFLVFGLVLFAPPIAVAAAVSAIVGLVVVSRRRWAWVAPHWQRWTIWIVGLLSLAHVSGLVPRTERFRERVTGGKWLQGVDADVSAAWIGKCDIQRLNVWDLAPSPHGEARSDFCFGDLDRAVLCVNLNASDVVDFATILREGRDSESRPFSQAAWETAAPTARIGLARDLVETRALIGLTLEEVESLLGPSSDQCRRLTWYREGWGDSTTIMLPLDADDRIDHRLPNPW